MKLFLVITCCCFSIAGYSQASSAAVKDYNLGKSNLALQGFDAVAYFTKGAAIKGSNQYAISYEGVLYYFANATDKESFKQNPGKYLPQYGGWCAYAMGDSGEKVEVDPETFKVQDGKLFLFYNKYFNNTLKSWNKDEQNLHRKADANWAKITARD